MNKIIYLEQLESCLKWKIPKAEVDDIMRDYAEYFEEGRSQGKTDSEICAKLGYPKIVAKQLIEESLQQKKEQDYSVSVKREFKKVSKENEAGNFSEKAAEFYKKFKNRVWHVLKFMGNAFVKICIFCMTAIIVPAVLLTGTIILGAGMMADILILFGFLLVCLSSILVIVMGLIFIALSGAGFLISGWTGLLFLSTSFGVLGIGICLLCLSMLCTQKVYKASCVILQYLAKKIKKIFLFFRDRVMHKKRKLHFKVKVKNPNVQPEEKSYDLQRLYDEEDEKTKKQAEEKAEEKAEETKDSLSTGIVSFQEKEVGLDV